MHFKGITCLTKVNKKQTKTERNENSILFNDSKIEIIDNNILSLDIKEREVFYLGSCNINTEKDYRGCRPIINIEVNWVRKIENEKVELSISSDVTDILIITSEVYIQMMENGYKPEEIYKEFRTKGLGQMSVNISGVEDFSALVAQIVQD